MSPSDHVLKVKADDEIADIAVYDGNMNVVAKGVGGLEQALPAGLYRVKIRVGSESAEQLAALDGNKTVEFDPVPFASAIPLNKTIKTHEYHMGAAYEASRNVSKQLGHGASIMVLAREWSPEGNQSAMNPAQGLCLLDPNEQLLSEIWNEADVRTGNGRDASAGWRADVNPGSYFLRLALDDPDKTALLRPIYVSPGHQLQVFCLVGNHFVHEGQERKAIRRADLAAASVVISQSGSFDPNDRLARLSELACNALAQARPLLPQPLVDELLDAKFDNPMLGLFGAHLLLKARPDDKALFRTVTDNLLRMLGPDHPDLQALWWQRGDEKPIGDGRLHALPMLSASWSLAVDRSIKTLDVLSLGTFYSKLTRIIPSAPWVMLMDNDWAVSDSAIEDYLKAREHAHLSRAQAKAALRMAAFQKHYVQRVYSTVRGMLPESVSSYLPVWSASAPAGERSAGLESMDESVAAPAPLESAERAQLARTLSIPVQMLDAILKQKGH